MNIPEEQVMLRTTLHWMYQHFPERRGLVMQHMFAFLTGFARGPRECAGVSTVLEVREGNIQGKFSEHSVNIQGISVNIQGTFSKHSVSMTAFVRGPR